MPVKTQHIEQSKKPELRQVLDFVEAHHANQAEYIGDSKVLLELGVENEVAQYWKGVIDNPMGSLYEVSGKLDDVFTQYANAIVKGFLDHNKDLIAKAVRTESNLFYCISLKRDTADNRTRINRFFSSYYDLPFAPKYQVKFQFVPKSLMGKIPVCEEII